MRNAKISQPMLALAAATAAATVASLPAEAQQSIGVSYSAVPDDAYSVVAQVQAKSGREDALREATLPLIAQVRGDPKNLVYFLQEDREKPGHFTFYEVFATQADFDAHNAMPYVKAWFARLPDLADGGVKVTRMRVLRAR
jgi:quinol monooxygenase YgiN